VDVDLKIVGGIIDYVVHMGFTFSEGYILAVKALEEAILIVTRMTCA